jgi:hypothetical protein
VAARGACSSRKSPKKRKYFGTLIDGLELAVATLSLQLIGHYFGAITRGIAPERFRGGVFHLIPDAAKGKGAVGPVG